MKPRAFIISVLVCLVAAAGCGFRAASQSHPKEPIYIGSKACGSCHDGPAMGFQFSKWMLSAHAKAYASLSLPESKEITRLSGITEPPHKSRMCLGCHATAADTEDWEKSEGFHLEDGLQCEMCHGPGSEYATIEVMQDRQKAMAAGLKMPSKDDCYICHRPKGSHVAVLNKESFNTDKAWEMIAHPIPRTTATTQPTNELATSKFKFIGVMACASCHTGPMFNFQFSKWRLSKHAQAWAVLGTQKGLEIAKERGVTGNPQEAVQCLKCHSTAGTVDASARAASFDPRDGVQCESCHGPGSEYANETVMRDKPAADRKSVV